MSNEGANASVSKNNGSALRTVICFVCLYAADVQFLLSLKLIFYDKEFATLGLSLVLLIVFLLPFLLLGQKEPLRLSAKLLGLIGPALIGLVGAVLIGLLQHEAVYAVLIGISTAAFGTVAFAVARMIRFLGFAPKEES